MKKTVLRAKHKRFFLPLSVYMTKALILLLILLPFERAFAKPSNSALPAVELPSRIFGLTIDKVSDSQTVRDKLKDIRDAAPENPAPVVRIVLDFGSAPSVYFSVIKEIRGRKNTAAPVSAFIMVELLDSYEASKCVKKPFLGKINFEESKQCYRQLTERYFNYQEGGEYFRDYVDVWEIGNEINGEWFGGKSNRAASACSSSRPPECNLVLAQIKEAYKVFVDEASGTKRAKTAVTFYFNDEGNQPGDHHSYSDSRYAMRKWIDDGQNFFKKVDYVFISYYEDDNFDYYLMPGGERIHKPIIPEFTKWAEIFKQIGDNYPEAKFGFGEFGPQCHYRVNDSGARCEVVGEKEDSCPKAATKSAEDFSDKIPGLKKRLCNCCLENQIPYINRYYSIWDREISLAIRKKYDVGAAARFAGGYFYWHFNPDVLDKFTFAKMDKYPEQERNVRRIEAENTLNELKKEYKNYFFQVPER